MRNLSREKVYYPTYQLARNILCRAISVKNASFERARKAEYDGPIFPRTYSQVPSKKIQNTFPTMYIQEKLSFYSSLSSIFFRSLISIFPLTRTWTCDTCIYYVDALKEDEGNSPYYSWSVKNISRFQLNYPVPKSKLLIE